VNETPFTTLQPGAVAGLAIT